jgi:hypothetical protein
MRATTCLWLAILLAGSPAASVFAAEPVAQWWERGQDAWYYKDDWRGLYLENAGDLKKTVAVPGPVKAAYAYVWASGEYVFKVNGKTVGRDADEGTIEDYDLRPHLVQGENVIEVLGRGEVICEGAAVLDSGKEILFGTDESWSARKAGASGVRRRGPRGYAGDSHMARIVEVTAEQKAKALVNRLNSARVRIFDREQFRFWRLRDPNEVLTLDRPTPERETWVAIERALEESRGPIGRATRLIKQGRYGEAEKAAAEAVAKTARAEGLLADLLSRLESAAAARAKALGPAAGQGEHVAYNGSAHNRLGWVASCEPLDSDPAYWEFDAAPPGAASIALAGWWKFALDPGDQGVAAGRHKPECDESGMTSIYAPVKWGWERYGHVAYNLNAKGWNKPYNGLAWYRKTVRVPPEWEGSDLILRLGMRWNNADWLAVNGEWISDPAGPGSGAEAITIPARLIRPGGPNTLALRVLNSDNIGGIVNPGLRLSAAGKVPQVRRHPCGPGAVREIVFDTPDGKVTQVIYSSALSPASVVATSGKALRLFGWQARGHPAPWWCTYMKKTGAGPQPDGLMLSQGDLVDRLPAAMAENWLLLRQAEGGPRCARPLLVVFEKRPTSLRWTDDGFGGKAMEMLFARAGARVALLRPFDEDPGGGKEDKGAPADAGVVERCRLWARALVRYPVGYLETLRFDGGTCHVRLSYEYLDLADDWGTKPLALAPLPMLFSYAIEHEWPGCKVEGEAAGLGCRAGSRYTPQMECGPYRAAVGARAVSYSFDRMEPRRRLVGAGTLGEERRLGEPMYAKMQEWGFNAFRPQTAIPAAADYADAGRIAEFQKMLDLSARHGMMCFVNWFTTQGVPKEKRQDFIDRWTAMARHCKDMPEDAIVYDFINEPAGFRWDDYNAFMKEVAAAVRKVDARHWISVEFGGGWAQPEDADMIEPTGDPKTIYQFHQYGPHAGDCHRRDLWYPRYQADEERFRSADEWEERMLPPIRFMIRNRAEMMHGEFGISFLGPDEAPRQWLETVLGIHDKYRIHWTWWNYSGDEIHRTGLVAGERMNPLVETLQKYARAAQPQ